MERFEYVTTSVNTSLRGKCRVKAYTDKEGKKRYVCKNVEYFDKNSLQLVLAVGFKGTTYHTISKNGVIKCFDADDNLLGTRQELDAEIRRVKYV